MMPRSFSVLLLLLLAHGSASAQGLIGPAGLGRLVLPLDARARGMGGAAVALHGSNYSAINPASLAGLTRSGAWATYMPEKATVKTSLGESDITSVDFALGRIAIPSFARTTIAIGFGAYLDQDWAVQFIDTLELSTGPVEYEELRQSTGGVSQFRLELSGMVSRGWSLGVAGILYSGQDRLKIDRAFGVESGLRPYRDTASVDHSGFGLSVGTELQPFPEMILGVVGTWGSQLNLIAGSSGGELEVDLPIAIDVGGSWQLGPDFIVALAAGWSNWSVANDDLEDGASDVWRFAGGLELIAMSGSRSHLALRLGAHWGNQPFKVNGESPGERAISLGMGAQLADGRARMDAALEFGKRADLDKFGVEESFRRATVSIAVFAN